MNENGWYLNNIRGAEGKACYWFLAGYFALCSVIFAVDVLTPVGTLAALLYVAPLLFSFRFHAGEKLPLRGNVCKGIYFWSPFILSFLTIVGVFFKQRLPSVTIHTIVFNRSSAIFCFWIISISAWMRDAAEVSLRKREAELCAFVENSPNIIMRLDANLNCLYVNSCGVNTFDLAREDIIGNSIAVIAGNEERMRAWRPIFNKVQESGHGDVIELQRPVGEEKRSFLIRVVPEHDKTGKQVHSFLLFGADVSELEVFEQVLWESQDDLSRAQTVAHIGSWRLNVQRNELLCSDQACRMFGISPDAPLTREIFLSYIPADMRTVVEQKWKAAILGKQYDVEYRIVVDGVVKWVREKAELEFDLNGKLCGGLGTVQDITDRVETVELMKASNRELEQFAYVASHDLQEPLRMVVSFTELLERHYKDRFDERGRGYMQYIVDGASRMQALIRDLLDFSRIGRLETDRRQIDCNAVVETVIADLSEIIKETHAEVTHDSLPAVFAEESNMSRLFSNLINNAIKFRKKEETPRVHIAAHHQINEWQFSVSDNGIGIDSRYFDKIFVIFQRLHKREEYAGSGLGLAICKKIVENHGGRIWVESRPGEGSTFWFAIPL
jgi:PAS domain S-box-containing protein